LKIKVNRKNQRKVTDIQITHKNSKKMIKLIDELKYYKKLATSQ